MRKKRDYASLILLLASLAVFAFAAWKLFGIYTEYHKGTETYEELQDFVQEPKEKDEPSTSEDGNNEESEDVGDGYLQVDFAGLKKVNPDVIAWIQIPALDISYPVVQGKDNYYYLHHMFDGQENKNGSIFVDYHNQPDFSDSNTIVVATRFCRPIINPVACHGINRYNDMRTEKGKGSRTPAFSREPCSETTIKTMIIISKYEVEYKEEEDIFHQQ